MLLQMADAIYILQKCSGGALPSVALTRILAHSQADLCQTALHLTSRACKMSAETGCDCQKTDDAGAGSMALCTA